MPLAGGPAMTFVGSELKQVTSVILPVASTSGRNRYVCEVGERASRTDAGHRNVRQAVIAILAEQKIFAIGV